MSPQILCALLDVRGQINLNLLQNCARTGAKIDDSELELLEDLALPVSGEASESHVLQSISCRLGLASDGRSRQLLLHQYSPDHALLAFTMPSVRNRVEDVLDNVYSLLSLYAHAVGTSVTRIPPQRSVPRLGEEIKLFGDWCWDRSRVPSEEILQLISACYIAVYLLTGTQEITLQLPTLSDHGGTVYPLTPVSLRMDAELPVNAVFTQLKTFIAFWAGTSVETLRLHEQLC